jgi:D-3-phosphoglycerate dehydrogenase
MAERFRFNVLITANRYRDQMDHERAILADRFPDLDVNLIGTAARTEQDLMEAAAEADAILLSTLETVSANLLDHLPRCKVIGRYGVGLDNVDLEAAAERGIVVTHFPSYCTNEVADHALSMILALNRRIVELDRDLRRGAWIARHSATRNILKGKVLPLRESGLGIVGFGRIGQAVAERARPFGMTLLVHDPYADPELIRGAGGEPLSLDDLMSQADIVTLHCPLTPETRGLIGTEQFDRMKQTAFLVNTARGPIVDLDAAIDALSNGKISGAGLDVTYPEPLPASSPLYALPNVILTPHSAYYSERSIDVVRDETFASTMMVLQGRRPPTIANPSVLERISLSE